MDERPPTTPARPRRRRAIIATTVLALALSAAALFSRARLRRFAPARSVPVGAPSTEVPRPPFLGPLACRECHAERFRTWAGSPHAAAALRLPARPTGPVPPDRHTLEIDERGQRLTVEISDHGAHQVMRWRDHDRDRVLTFAARFAIGSGTKGYAWMGTSDEDPTLQMLPANYYTARRAYGPMPGGIAIRAATPVCLSCHATTVEVAPAPDGAATRTATDAVLPIGCERCHGPGEAHARACAPRDRDPAACRGTIVHPRRLAPARQLDVCAQCHIGSHGTDEVPGGGFLAFRPGLDLARFVTINPGPGVDDSLEVSSQVERWRGSACYRASGASCLACHDPHAEPGTDGSAARHACTERCHTPASCRAPPLVSDKAGKDCVDCHMPMAWADSVNSPVVDHRVR